MENKELLKAMKEMMRDELDVKLDPINKELKEIKSQVIENTEILNSIDDKLNNLEATNAANHIEIKGQIEETKETVDKMETSLELVKIATVANSKDIESLKIVK